LVKVRPAFVAHLEHAKKLQSSLKPHESYSVETSLYTAALLLLLAGGAVRADDSSGADSSGAPQPHVVTIENMKFEPATLKVKRGDVVVWSNKDLFPIRRRRMGRRSIPAAWTPGSAGGMSRAHEASMLIRAPFIRP